jgi:hypothetical protein
MKNLILNLVLLSSVCSILGGCLYYPGRTKDAKYLISKDWAAPAPQNNTDEHLYCYKTLGGNDCYTAPLERRENSRQGGYTESAPVLTDSGTYDPHLK